MRPLLPLLAALVTVTTDAISRAQTPVSEFRTDADRLVRHCLADSSLYHRVADFVDHFPARLSGTAVLERGIDTIVARLRSEGWDVRTQAVTVPVWKRGRETAHMTAPLSKPLPMLGLGGSVGTGGKPLRAPVLVVTSFDDLTARAAEARGRIVLFDVPFTSYGETVAYRYGGASAAARVGAVACLVRSVGPYGMQTPHTGGMGYTDGVPRIPAAAITMEDAMMMHRMQDRGEHIEVELSMEATTAPDAPSRNVVVELRGVAAPTEVVVMGGHIDAWDVGQGAMDDAGGCFAALRALEAIRALGMRPRRTIRVVFWTNEENGLRGGKAYAEQTAADRHVLAIESDEGTFAPKGFSTNATGTVRAVLDAAGAMLAPVGADTVVTGGGGADIGPLEAKGVPVMSLQVDASRYFWYHHTNADTIDKLDARDLNRCAAALAVMAWVGANADGM